MRVDFFAGNTKTGEITSQSLEFQTKEEAEEVQEEILDELLTEVGYEGGIWAVYASGGHINEHTADFKRYLAYRKTKTETEEAA